MKPEPADYSDLCRLKFRKGRAFWSSKGMHWHVTRICATSKAIESLARVERILADVNVLVCELMKRKGRPDREIAESLADVINYRWAIVAGCHLLKKLVD